MGIMESILGGSSTRTPKVSVIADPYKEVREALNKYLTSNVSPGATSYKGELSADMTDQEKRSMSSLNDYANRKTPETTQAARGEVLKTLSGNYDPSTSPYYQAVKAEAARNLQQQNEIIGSNAAGGGRYYSGGRMREQREAGVDMGNRMNTVLGELAENERNRMTQAVNQAQSLGNDEDQEKLNTTAALQQYGSLPRNIQQAALDKMYEEWNTANRDYPSKVAGIASGVQEAPMYGEDEEIPSTAMAWLGSLVPGVGSYNVAKYGYSTDQYTMSKAINDILKLVGGAGGAGAAGGA